jgi:hypothetical protein
MSVISSITQTTSTSSSAGSQGTIANIDAHVPQVDMGNLGTIVQEWRRLYDDIDRHKQAVREKSKRLKVLDSIIMSTMKQSSLDALNLSSSGGRILYKKSTSRESLAPKTLEKFLTEYFKDAGKAADALKFINEHRGQKVREAIKYQRDE